MYPLLYVFCNTAFVETLERIRREILPIITNEAADYSRDQLVRNTKISVKESTLEYCWKHARQWTRSNGHLEQDLHLSIQTNTNKKEYSSTIFFLQHLPRGINYREVSNLKRTLFLFWNHDYQWRERRREGEFREGGVENFSKEWKENCAFPFIKIYAVIGSDGNEFLGRSSGFGPKYSHSGRGHK